MPGIVLTLILGALIAAASPASAVASASAGRAQGDGERIVSYDTTITIQADGDLLVEEVIVYDFGRERRHGIYRDLQTRYDYDDRYERVYPVEVLGVAAPPGTPADYERTTEGRLLRIRIGDPDRTITGQHRYTIRYRVAHALNGFEDHDELYWNAPSTEWPVPIDSARTVVVVPGDVSWVACFAGPFESRLPCGAATDEGAVASFTQTGLGVGEGMTVVVGFPRGLVPAPSPKLDERWHPARAFAATPATVGASVGLLVLLVGGILLTAWRRGRDRRFAGSPVDVVFGNDGGEEHEVPLFERPLTPVELTPPEGLRPGQVGTLLDEVASPLDVTATIVDLAVRGFLRIEEIPKEGWFGKPDWRLAKVKPATGLHRYEELLFDALFEGRPDGEVLLSQLKDRFAARLAKVQDALYEDAVAAGWFAARPDRVRALWTALGVVVLLAGIGLTALAAIYTHLGLVPLPIAVAGVVLMVVAGRMPRRTAIGTGTLRRVLGFRRFIDESERDRAQFAERQQLFTEYLPYAVVFGATERWARAFAGLDGEVPSTGGWYVSHHPFDVGGFSSSMDSFTTVTAGTIASTPSSSGASGRGGSSGGGGGGGGGGSW